MSIVTSQIADSKPGTEIAGDSAPAAPTPQEFFEGFAMDRAIAPPLMATAARLIEDTGRWEPQQVLGLEVKTQWQTRKPHNFGALIGFHNADGILWQAKPLNPREIDSKIVKYETLKGGGSRAFLPAIDNATWAKIADKSGVPRDGTDFWAWVRANPKISIVLTEGAGKALALLSAGYVAIALTGCNGGYHGGGEMQGDKYVQVSAPKLIADLDFAANGRQIVIAMDADTNPKTVKRVQGAISKFGGLLEDAGAIVRVATWDGQGGQCKGADDLIATAGVSAWEEVYKEAVPLAVWFAETRRADDPAEPGFSSTPELGLLYTWAEVQKDTSIELKTIRVGNHLQAIAYVNAPDGDNAGLLLEFKTYRGAIVRWVMDRRDLGGDIAIVLSNLMAREYSLAHAARKQLTRYLCELGKGLDQSYTVTDATGWVGDSFVLPGYTVGDETIRFQNVEPQDNGPISVKSTAQSWADTVGRKCEGNSRAIFAVGTAFAAPLQTLLDVESGGFHIVGGTSQGKTTLLTVAASTVGIKKIPSWNSTTNGLESVACAHNNLLLPLDEIGQADPREVGKAAYLLGNGQGKTRMTKALTNRKPKQWQLFTLSSGEVSIVEYLKQGGSQVKGGMEVRMLDIPAVPKNGQYGAFESIHGATTAAAFVAELERDCAQYHGAVFKEYLEHLVAARKEAEFTSTLNRRLWEIVKALIGGEKDSMIGRAAKRFALVQLGLEIAYRHGLLPFPVEQCAWAISTIFQDWMDARGGAGSIEVKQCCVRIEELFVTSQHSDRIYDLGNPDRDRPIRDLIAYTRLNVATDQVEYLVPTAVFTSLATGVDKAALLAELAQRGWLAGQNGEKTQVRKGPNGRNMRVFVFTAFWMGDEAIAAPHPSTPSPTPSESAPIATTAEPQPLNNPSRWVARWVPTHQTAAGEPVAIERRYGAGLAAVRDGTGQAFQVPEAELTPLGREVAA
jgi:putative DNA primase/helicase